MSAWLGCVDAGLNLSFAGPTNKLQASVTYFDPEDGDGQAFILRLQHQFNF